MAGASQGNAYLQPMMWGGVNTMTAGGPGGDPSAGSGTPSWVNDLTNLTNLGGSIYGLVNSSKLSGDANTVFQQSNPFGQYRPGYGKQLLDLMQNPSSVTSLPGYNFLMDQGTQAVTRSAYGPGGTGAGGQLSADLMKYGQGLADQFYNQQVTTLSHLAGADIQPANPYQALQGKGGAATGLGSSIAGLAGGIGSTASLLSKLFGSSGVKSGSGTSGGSAGSGLSASDAAMLSQLFSGTYGQTPVGGTGFDNVSSQTGYDPFTGQFSGGANAQFLGAGSDFSNFSLGSGYNPSTGDFSGLGTLNLNDITGITSVNTDPGYSDGFSSGGGGGGGLDLSGMFSNPKAAGGEAANLTQNPNAVSGGGSGIGNLFSTGSQALGAVQGIMSGKPLGYAAAGIDLTKILANNPAITGITQDTASTLKGATGYAGNILSIIQGIQSGGVTGDTQAAAAAAQLASKAGLVSAGVGTAAGYVAAPLALYNFAKNWQSGNTGSDAIQGAEAGAAVGSVIPVIGTAIGAIAGGLIGALTSAFGPGVKDAETATAQKLIDWTSQNKNSQAGAMAVQNPYLMLQGIMDQHSSSVPIATKYGRMNAEGFSFDMMSQINNAVKSGQISKTDSPQTVFSKIVLPWVNQMGDWSQVGDTYQNVISGLLQNMTAQYMSGKEYSDWTAVGGDNPFLGAVPFGGTYVAQPIGPSSSPGHTGGATRPF